VKLPNGGTLLLLPLTAVLQHMIESVDVGPLLHFEYDSTAHGEFWGHAYMMIACQKAKQSGSELGVFPFALWIDGGRLSNNTNSRSLHPILLIPLGMPVTEAIAHRTYQLVGYISSNADYIEAAYALGRKKLTK
jgi:hypothetical protein